MTSPEIIDIDTFAQNLNLITSNILRTVHRQQSTAVLPLHVDKEWLLNRIREQLSNGGYMIEPKATGPSNALGPFFNTLPKELRTMIFADCLKSGYPQFMASSRAMTVEGLHQIWDKAVYRMTFGVKVRMVLALGKATRVPDCRPPPQEIANKIQHLCIRVTGTATRARHIWSEMDFDAIRLFGGSEVRRKSCKIWFRLRYDYKVFIGDEVFRALRTLVGFDRVELRIIFPTENAPRRLSVSQIAHIREQMKKAYAFCANVLMFTLGFPSEGWGEEGRCLLFTPRKARARG